MFIKVDSIIEVHVGDGTVLSKDAVVLLPDGRVTTLHDLCHAYVKMQDIKERVAAFKKSAQEYARIFATEVAHADQEERRDEEVLYQTSYTSDKEGTPGEDDGSGSGSSLRDGRDDKHTR